MPNDQDAQYLRFTHYVPLNMRNLEKNDEVAITTIKKIIENTESDEISTLGGDEQTSIRYFQTLLQDLHDILDKAYYL